MLLCVPFSVKMLKQFISHPQTVSTRSKQKKALEHSGAQIFAFILTWKGRTKCLK